MSSATGSRSYIAMIKQAPTTPRVIPTAPVMQKVNFVSDDLHQTIATKVSAHIRSDRMTSDLTRTGYSVGGGYNFEFQYENSLADELLLAALWCEEFTANVAENGSFYQPFYIERGHADVSQYFRFLGMVVDKMTLNFPDQAAVTGSYQFVGLESSLYQAVFLNSTYTEPAATPIFSTVYHVTEIAIDGVALTSCLVKDMTIEINNNVTPKTGIGVLGACETVPHTFAINGKITLYFEDESFYAKFLAGTAFSLGVSLLDENGDGYDFLLPRCKIQAETVPVTGQDADIMENVTYIAIYDPTEECMIRVTKVIGV